MKRLFLIAVTVCAALTLGSCSNNLYKVHEVTRIFTASQTYSTENTEEYITQSLKAKIVNEAMEWRESREQPYSKHFIQTTTRTNPDGTRTVDASCEMRIWDLQNIRTANKKSNKRK